MFIIEVPYLNLNQIYNSGQILNWIKIKEDSFIIFHKDQALKIEQKKDRLIMQCTEEQFYTYWYDYFNLQDDYLTYNFKIAFLDDFLKVCSNRAKGIRIIKRDLFELIICSIIQANLSLNETIRIMDIIRKKCGIMHIQSIKGYGRIRWYEFPSPELLLNNTSKIADELDGKAINEIEYTCLSIIENWIDLEDLHTFRKQDIYEHLMLFMSSKAAKLVCLYGFNAIKAEVNDKSTKSIVSKFLKDNIDCDWKEFKEWYLDKTSNKGLIMHYVLYNALNPPRDWKEESRLANGNYKSNKKRSNR